MRRKIIAIALIMLTLVCLPLGNIVVSAQISDFGRQAAEDFLSGYLSLFGFGWYRDGVFGHWWGPVVDEVPMVYVHMDENGGIRGIFDRWGNLISDDAPFIWRGGDVAAVSRFYLYDLNNDGIPQIVIWGGVPETCNVGSMLYMFVDGEYQNVRLVSPFRFYTDEQGRTVMVEGHIEFLRLSHLTFTHDGMEIDVYVESCCCYYEDLTRLLTPIEPLHELHAEVTASINQRLGLTRVTDIHSAAPATFDPIHWATTLTMIMTAILIISIRFGRRYRRDKI